MKVAFLCDQLVRKSAATYVLDALCPQFPDAKIYTLAHIPGKCKGHIEMHSIQSTYLSHMVKDWSSFLKKAFLAPWAFKSLKFDEDIDVMIVISEGLSHAHKLPKNMKVLTYFQRPIKWPSHNFLDQIKFSYLKKWRERMPTAPEQVLFAYKYLKQQFNLEGEILYPSINVQDFPIPRSQNLALDYYVICIDPLTTQVIHELIDTFNQFNTKVKFVSYEKVDNNIKEKCDQSQFVELIANPFEDELHAIVSQGRAYLDLEESFNSHLALASLSSGRPVALVPSDEQKELFDGKDFGIWVKNTVIRELIMEMDQKYRDYGPEQLHRCVLPYQDVRFKVKFSKFVDSLS